MSKSDGVHEEGGVCARCGGLVFDPVIPQNRQEWVGLTDDERDYIVRNSLNVALSIEEKLKEKNT